MAIIFSDLNTDANSLAESAGSGISAGVTVSAVNDAFVPAEGLETDTITYSLSSNPGNLFAIGSSSGIVTLSSTGSLDYETATSHTIEVTATSADTSTSTQSYTIGVTDVNEAPSISTGTSGSVAENAATSTVIYDAAASDQDTQNNSPGLTINHTVAVQNVGGQNVYVIDGSQQPTLNLENGNTHVFDVSAINSAHPFKFSTTADGTHGGGVEFTDGVSLNNGLLTILVTDTTPETLSYYCQFHNGMGGNLNVDLGETVTFSVDGADKDLVNIDGSTGEVTLVSSANFESAKTSYSFDVIATDRAGLTDTQNVNVSVTDVDEYDVSAISDDDTTANTLAENASSGATVGITAAASDSDGTTNTITYSLSSNPGNLFAIGSSSGIVTLSSTGSLSLDYETATSHTIEVTATSADASTSTASYDIAVTDVDEYDVSAVSDDDSNGNTLAENASSGAAVGITAAASDSDGTTNTITYSLSSNPGNLFAIGSSSGIVTLSSTGSLSLDYETATSHTIEVTATSADASTSTASYDIAVTDVDEYDVSAVSDDDSNGNTLAENASSGAAVGITAAASDSDGTTNTITYSLSSNPGNLFAIGSSSGIVTLSSTGSLSLDYETATSHTIEVTATSADASTSTASYDIAVTDVDEYDVSAISDDDTTANTLAENASSGAAVGITAAASDSDGTTNTITYSLSSNPGNLFAIGSSSGIVTLSSTGSLSLDYETATSHTIEVTATSADASTSTASYDIAVTDVDEYDVTTPTDGNGATNEIDENAVAGTVGITASASDADGTTNTITYSLTNDDGGNFDIDSGTGVVSTTGPLNHEEGATRTIEVTATSADGSSKSETFTIAVNDINEAPIIESGTTGSVYENASSSEVIYDINATDVDDDTLTYSHYGTDAGQVTVDSDDGEIRLISPADFETQTSYSFTVSVTDGVKYDSASVDVSLTDSENVQITVTDINEKPVVISGSTASVDENMPTSTVVYDASGSDVDGDNITFSLGGTDAGYFNIDADDGEVRLKASADYETKTSYDFTVIATDDGPAPHVANLESDPKSVTLSVIDDPIDTNNSMKVTPTGYVTTDLGGGLQSYPAGESQPFLGGDAWDVLTFEHSVSNGKTFVGLDSGHALFGDGVASPLVSFAEIGVGTPYDVDWERVEILGSTDDTIITSLGLSAENANRSLAVGDDEIIEGFFELDTGDGNDVIKVNDVSQAITLDLGAAYGHTSLVMTDASGNDGVADTADDEVKFTFDKKESVDGVLATSAYSTLVADGVVGSNPTDGVIDYLSYDDGGWESVLNNSQQGIAVDFGTSDGDNRDVFEGSSKTDSDLIDLRGTDGVIAISDSNQSASGSKITIDIGGNVDIDAHSVDLLYVSELDASDNAIASDSDVLFNAEALYGDAKGILGQASYDHNGDGYDVITSAKLVNWADQGDQQIYYDGDHTDFTDSGDLLDRNASTYSVATTGVTAEQKGWMSAVDTANNGAATPSFYIIDPVSEKKVPVYLDDTDSSDVQWKVDTTSFSITSQVTISDGGNSSTIQKNIMDAYGVNVDPAALMAASSVYLNATETDIGAFLDLNNGGGVAGVASASAFDFGFYTQVVGTDANSNPVVVNIGLDHSYTAGDSWSLNASDVLVKMDYNTVATENGAAVGGTGGDFIEAATQAMALGNAGSDTYQLDASDQAIVHEIGDLMGGLVSDEDSVQFELATDMEQLNFTRGRMAGEADGNSLFITSATSGDAKLFDQYNDFLSFRKTEYLVIDDGATSNEVFELVTGDASTNNWANEIYVAKNTGDSINVLEGGEDHVFLGAGNDTVSIDQTSLTAASAGSDGDSVTIRNVDVANDTVKVNGSNLTMTGANIDTVVVTKTTTKFFDLDGGWEVDYEGTQIQALI